jgi:hypothetical protein
MTTVAQRVARRFLASPLTKGTTLLIESRKGRWPTDMPAGSVLVVQDAEEGGDIRLNMRGWAQGGMTLKLPANQNLSRSFKVFGGPGRLLVVTRTEGLESLWSYNQDQGEWLKSTPVTPKMKSKTLAKYKKAYPRGFFEVSKDRPSQKPKGALW